MTQLIMLTSISAQYTDHWESDFAPRYRAINKVTINDNNRYFAVGGWEENDAISTIYYSDDTCHSWVFALDEVNAWLQDISFPTTDIGYVVGHAGSIYKTTNEGSSWELLSLTGNAAGRNFNGVHFFNEQTGIIVGGNESNDAIQTILKTTDGGVNWTVISDNIGPWLKDVYFVDELIGYACGDAGTILKTINGGNSWETLVTPNNIQNRQLNSIFFLNTDLGYAVGGNPTNDSIQSIIKTTDGGNSWVIIKDEMGNMLNSVFAMNEDVFAVGNWGEMLYSSNLGETWELLDIAANDTVNLNDIYFKSSIQGIAGGYIGKYLSYFDHSGNEPDLYIDSPVFVLSPNSVRIEGGINPNSKPTSLKFEYGETTEFGQMINIGSDSIIGDETQEVAFNLDNLQEHMMYYGRLKATNIYGTTYSETITFFVGVNYIPNFSFENWTTTTNNILSNWNNEGNIQEVESYDGSKAVQISGANNNLGVIYYGEANDQGLSGGVEYTERPDTISFWAKYDIAEYDTALVIFHLKDNNETTIAKHMFKITGSSNNEFVQLKYAIDYQNDLTPELLFFGFLSTNPFTGEPNTASILTIDNLHFHSVNTQIPNADMEAWEEAVDYNVDEWISRDDMHEDEEKMVTQYDDAYSGNLALKLSNIITDDYKQFAYVRSGNNLYDRVPSFPVNYKHDALYGYFQFFPDNNDTLFIEVELYSQGEQLGYGRKIIHETVDSYTLFEIPINYYNETIPDSASIYISIAKENYEGIPGASYAIIDNFSFDAIISPQSVTAPTIKEAAELWVYPNPASDYLNIDFSSLGQNLNGDLYLLDLQGRIVYQQNMNTLSTDRLQLDLSPFSPQLYILLIQTDTYRYTKKIILK